MKVKEVKKPMNIIVKPSAKEKGKKKAAKQGISLSQLVENFFEQ